MPRKRSAGVGYPSATTPAPDTRFPGNLRVTRFEPKRLLHPVLSRDRWAKGLKAGLLENSNRADILPGDIRVERSPDIRKRSKAETAAARKKASKKR